MRIDLNTYSLSKKFIQDNFIAKYKDDPGFAVSLMSAVTHVPVLVSAFFVAEADGWSDKSLIIIDNIIKFYGYKKIDNIPNECPKKFL